MSKEDKDNKAKDNKLDPILKLAIEKQSIVEDSWRGFAKIVLPGIHAEQVQFTEMRKAYYCGFYAAFDLMQLVASGMNEDQAMLVLMNIEELATKEIKKFANWKSL